MIVIDELLLATFRACGTCELCGRRVYPLDPHHAFVSRGCGGGTRLDLDVNLAALCRICHGNAHEKTDVADEVRAVVARRHGLTVDQILCWLWAVNRESKHSAMPCRPWEKLTA